jgi:hypothetical protein
VSGFLETFAHDGVSLQQSFDVAVVMPTILRPEIKDALDSIFAQEFQGRIQVLIGIDVARGDPGLVAAACAARPAHCVVQLFHPGYSTSVRHGGLCSAQDGGVLRSVLSHLANSPLLAYLDDDNWWHPAHLRLLVEAIRGRDYAYNLRWFVHPCTKRIVARDDWESVGQGRGVFTALLGGFIDPNCLMLDKRRCFEALQGWMQPLAQDPKGMSADRTVFQYLSRHHTGAGTNLPTVYYRMDPGDPMHAERMKVMSLMYEMAGG